jgi:hypothetical protein
VLLDEDGDNKSRARKDKDLSRGRSRGSGAGENERSGIQWKRLVNEIGGWQRKREGAGDSDERECRS